MVMRPTNMIKRVPEGSEVRILTDIPDLDIEKGDQGILRVEKKTLPRGRGVTLSYHIDFDDGTSVMISPETSVFIVSESPKIRQKRRETYSEIGKRVGRVGKQVARLIRGPETREGQPKKASALKKFLFEGPSPLQEKSSKPSLAEPSRPEKQRPEDMSNEDFWLGKKATKTSKEDDMWFGEGEWKDPLA